MSLCNRLATLYEPGYKLKEILLLSTRKNRLILSMKQSLVTAAQNKTLPNSIDQLTEGTVVHGYVGSIIILSHHFRYHGDNHTE
jgi:hypothetical protein